MLSVFTLITKEDPGYFKLLRSAKKWGWSLQTIFVPPTPGLSFEENYHDFISRKHLLIREALLKYAGDTFLFLDGWDTMFIGPPELTNFDPGLLYFSGSSDCYPEAGYKEFFTEGFHPYLNSGVIWGSTRLYFARCPQYQVLDQLAWTRAWMSDSRDLRIDSDCVNVYTQFPDCSPSSWRRNKGGRWTFLPTFTQPVIYHAAGKSGMPSWF